MMKFSNPTSNAREMDANRRELLMQRWNVIQHDLLPELRIEVGALTPKLEKVIHTLEWVRIEEFVTSSWCGIGRPPHERGWLANALVAKAVLGLADTRSLIERLSIDRALRRICGFPLCKKLPSEATFSRAFEEFAENCLAERVHEALVKECLGDELIGHISRDGTAIAARPGLSPCVCEMEEAGCHIGMGPDNMAEHMVEVMRTGLFMERIRRRDGRNPTPERALR